MDNKVVSPRAERVWRHAPSEDNMELCAHAPKLFRVKSLALQKPEDGALPRLFNFYRPITFRCSVESMRCQLVVDFQNKGLLI